MSGKPKPIIKIRPKQVAQLPTQSSVWHQPPDFQDKKEFPLCENIPFWEIPATSSRENPPINQDLYLEFVFTLNGTGRLNVNQVSYLTEYMDNETSLWSKLDDLNLRNAFISWNDKAIKDMQDKALQDSIIADHLKSLKGTLAAKEKNQTHIKRNQNP